MSTFAVFLSLYFFVLFLHTFTKTIHLWSSMRKTSLCTSMTNLFRTRIRTLLFTSHGLYTNPIYVQRSFSFFSNTDLQFTQKFLHIHLLLTHIRIPFHASFTQTFYTHFPFTYMYKNFFLFFTNMTFIHDASFFLLGFLVHFFQDDVPKMKKLYTDPKFQQTLLTTTKQVPT